VRYLGGKSKIRKQVASFLEGVRKPNQAYLEPFVGGGWILQEMSGERHASDGNVALISMYQALQNGWKPPEFVSEGEYRRVNFERNMTDPLTAFCGFGCSFAGKWFGGYARGVGRCFPKETHDNLIRQLPKIQDVHFSTKDYQEHSPREMLIYCDPPYESTTSYGAFDGFDHNEFWQTMREWSRNNTVVISEYSAPEDFICVLEMKSRMGLTTDNKKPERTEKLFMLIPDWLR